MKRSNNRNDLLSEEEKQHIKELEAIYSKRLQDKLNEVETRERNKLVERQTGFKVKNEP